jgi:hypothetical protein
MSKYFFERLVLDAQPKKLKVSVDCLLPWCNDRASVHKGPGSRLCKTHQALMREYGGPARIDRQYTFNKNTTCDFCGFDPWQHPIVMKINNQLVQDRVAWGMLIVDHIVPQKYGGGDHPTNCQTLCLDCNQIKTTLACDSMPKALYKNPDDYYAVKAALKEYHDACFIEDNIYD